MSQDDAKIDQALAQIREELARGRWSAGQRLPSTRELGRRYGMSRSTVYRALTLIADEGVLEPHARSGWRVCEAEPLAKHRARRRGRFAPVKGSTRDAATQVAVSIGAQFDPRLGAREAWSGHLMVAMQAALLDRDMDMLVLSHNQDEQIDPAAFCTRIDAAAECLAGVIFIQPAALVQVQGDLDERDVPWVTINRPHTRFPHNFVTADNVTMGAMVGGEFARRGYQRVLVLGGRFASFPTCREKFEGFCSGYAEARGQMPPLLEYLPCHHGDRHPGRDQIESFVASHGRPDGVFATGDYLALAASTACREQGFRVPEDVGIVGGTGLSVARHVSPALTTADQPMEAMGAAAVAMLLEMASSGSRRVPGRIVPGSLTFRESFPGSPADVGEADGFSRGRSACEPAGSRGPERQD